MSTKNTVQIDARREEFRKYLEKEGILESLTKSLVIRFLYVPKHNFLVLMRLPFATLKIHAISSYKHQYWKFEKLKTTRVLITIRFNDKILGYHFLVPVEHKTS